ncbi:MAG: hypothetical protein U0W24_10560 [Bacteroidales bacterium]
MRTCLFIIAITVLYARCGQNTTNSSNIESDSSIIDKSKETVQAQSDTFTTDQSCVIFLMPDTIEIEKMQKENSEEDYSEIVADITWYPGVAGEVLDSFKITNDYVDNQHILLFKQKNGTITQLDKRKIEGDMILFRCDSLPYITYAIDFDREFTLKFFRKK